MEARIAVRHTALEFAEGGGDEYGCFVRYFKVIGFAPFALRCTVGVRLAETPVPDTCFQLAVRVEDAPFIGFGTHGFCGVEIFAA